MALAHDIHPNKWSQIQTMICYQKAKQFKTQNLVNWFLSIFSYLTSFFLLKEKVKLL